MKKVTISINIPALNEEQNISSLVLSILKQKLGSFVLSEIVVYSDGSTDKTAEIVTKLKRKYDLIKLIKKKERKGKYARMNELFARCRSDVLIIMDADIAMIGDHFIKTLVSSLVTDKKALMVSARNIFVKPQGFIPRVLHAHFTMWDNILLGSKDFQSSAQFSGTATAFRGSYARVLQIPQTVTNPHLFLYLHAMRKKGFRFCPAAKLLQYVPSTLHEVKTMLVRAIVKPDEELDKLFSKKFIRKYQNIPLKLKLLVMVKSFWQNPFYTPFAIVMTFYIQRMGRRLKRSNSQLWETNRSTKKMLAYVK